MTRSEHARGNRESEEMKRKPVGRGRILEGSRAVRDLRRKAAGPIGLGW